MYVFLAKFSQMWPNLAILYIRKKVACEVHNPFFDAVDNDELDLLTQSQPSLLVYSWDYFRFFEYFLNRSSQPCSYGLKVRNCLPVKEMQFFIIKYSKSHKRIN